MLTVILVGLFSKNKVVVTMGVQYISSYIVDCVLAGIHFQFHRIFLCLWQILYRVYSQYDSHSMCKNSGIISGICHVSRHPVPDGICGTGWINFISIVICVGAFVWMKRRGTLYKANL